ncbi:K+-transporting ATPase subunit F [Desulfotomaculum copahuensis]|uniref:K+-transporting ATPase subunit F n=1 Tax=Desulfotomaculum copahuensis TaxID=1838280 RepID=A0A1B7LI51_9FIRM|nr:K+-transporting ATPase subunit F [Desulfotomaculum copahuensis]
MTAAAAVFFPFPAPARACFAYFLLAEEYLTFRRLDEMNWQFGAGLLLGLALMAYLFYALIKPEKF